MLSFRVPRWSGPVAAVATIAFFPLRSSGYYYTWQPNGYDFSAANDSGYWENSANWEGADPNSFEFYDLGFSLSENNGSAVGPYSVTLSVPSYAFALYDNGDTVALITNNNYLTVIDSFQVDSAFSYTYSGGIYTAVPDYNDPGAFFIDGGTFSVGGSEVIGAVGPALFSQAGGTHAIGSDLIIGQTAGAEGTFDLSVGTLAGTLTVGGFEYVGGSGNGTFNQTGASNSVSYDLLVGDGAGAEGTFALSAGELNVENNEIVGNLGAGTFTQSGGTNTITGSLTIAAESGSTGIYTLSGGTFSAQSVTVGDGGSGELDVKDGMQMILPGPASVAAQPGSVGTISIDGTGTRFEAASLSVGGSGAVAGGQAIFSLSSGATAHVASLVTIGNQASINITGGALTIGSTNTPAAMGNIQINSDGTLGGAGEVTGNVVNAGTVAPAGPATLTINGNYTQSGAGVVQFEIAGTTTADYDHLAVKGALSLESGAVLQLNFTNNFTPQVGDTFYVISYGTNPGSAMFSGLQVEGLGAGYEFTATDDGTGFYVDTLAVPELSSWTGLLFVIGGLACRRSPRRGES